MKEQTRVTMKIGWWDNPLALRDLAEATPITSDNELPLLTENNFQIPSFICTPLRLLIFRLSVGPLQSDVVFSYLQLFPIRILWEFKHFSFSLVSIKPIWIINIIISIPGILSSVIAPISLARSTLRSRYILPGADRKNSYCINVN